MSDLVPRLMDYVETFPPDGDANELKDQLSACTHRDLRAACSRLNLRGARKQNKKGGFISLLVSYWKGDEENHLPEQPVKPNTLSDVMNEATDVTHFVQVFPPYGDIDELRDQLNGCKARTLRSACVLLELHPKKNHAKPNFVGLLVGYWKDSVACAPKKGPTETPTAGKTLEPTATPKKTTKGEEKGEKTHPKRVREEVKKKEAPKKKKVMERSGDSFEEEKSDAMAASLEKAKVVKEWASAIEILSRVDGSAKSIASIRALIGGVVDSAVSEL